MPSVVFEWKSDSSLAAGTESWHAGLRLSDIVLERNARWFITVRWFVVVVLVFVQVVIVSASGLLARIGIVAQGWWPLLIAGVLVFSNILFVVFLLQPRLRALVHPHANMWAQIIVDLVCLTILVHYCGSIATPVPFLYVLHIVLSCVFLSIKSSFTVAFIAIIFYLSCVSADLAGAFEHYSIFAALTSPLFSHSASACWAGVLSLVFLAVWYLVSQLSLIIRTRESQLIDAHEQIQNVQKEKDRYAVQMTHQLKAPLDAVRSTIALITGGYCQEVSEEICDLLSRIDRRVQGMAGLVMDVLKLARIKASPDQAGQQRCDIGTILRRSIENLKPVAAAHHITIEAAIESWETQCIPDQIEMLFDNIISNAVAYSKNGQTVTITCTRNPDRSKMAVSIADKGIGIETNSLPHIFDEYFRAPEAVRHNSASSGIGLAIVKAVAQSHGLSIRVDSVHGYGTTFSVEFPHPASMSIAPVTPSGVTPKEEIL